MNRTPKLANLWGVFMAKYTECFKLKVINHCLDGYSYKRTAKYFNLDHKIVELWVKPYQAHGMDGIKRRYTKTVYTIDFKLSAVQ